MEEKIAESASQIAQREAERARPTLVQTIAQSLPVLGFAIACLASIGAAFYIGSKIGEKNQKKKKDESRANTPNQTQTQTNRTQRAPAPSSRHVVNDHEFENHKYFQNFQKLKKKIKKRVKKLKKNPAAQNRIPPYPKKLICKIVRAFTYRSIPGVEKIIEKSRKSRRAILKSCISDSLLQSTASAPTPENCISRMPETQEILDYVEQCRLDQIDVIECIKSNRFKLLQATGVEQGAYNDSVNHFFRIDGKFRTWTDMTIFRVRMAAFESTRKPLDYPRVRTSLSWVSNHSKKVFEKIGLHAAMKIDKQFKIAQTPNQQEKDKIEQMFKYNLQHVKKVFMDDLTALRFGYEPEQIFAVPRLHRDNSIMEMSADVLGWIGENDVIVNQGEGPAAR